MQTYTDPYVCEGRNKENNRTALLKLLPNIFSNINKTLMRLVKLHVFFSGVIAAQIISLCCLLIMSGVNFVTAILAASSVFSIFIFLAARIFFNYKTSEKLEKICASYMDECKAAINYESGVPDHYSSLAFYVNKLASALQDNEYSVLKVYSFMSKFSSMVRRFSCVCFWRFIRDIRENLLFISIDELIKSIHSKPMDINTHISLANTYVWLSGLYADPRKTPSDFGCVWVPKNKYNDDSRDKFLWSSERAIEEFKIINESIPDAPWIHKQLASSYRELLMPNEEIFEYEKILELDSEDVDSMLQLGILYFKQGMNAKGLRIYEKLKMKNYKKSTILIQFYGSFIY